MKILKQVSKLIPLPLRNKIKIWQRYLRLVQQIVRSSSQSGVVDYYANVAFSQEGEDRILFSLFSLKNKKKGFYIDVGAYHPVRFSNTFALYLQGWRGINIDANSESIKLFQKMRPGDINLAVGVGEKHQQLPFFVFDEPAVSTFDKKNAEYVVSNTAFKLVKTQTIDVLPLSTILDKYASEIGEIDLLSVDVEAKDLEVLRSNDWSKYRPHYIVVECYGGHVQKEGFSFEEIVNNELSQYLKSKGYKPFAKTLNSIFYMQKESPIETIY